MSESRRWGQGRAHGLIQWGIATVGVSALTAGLLAAAGTSPSSAAPPAPVILNSGSGSTSWLHWLESNAVSDDHDATGNRAVTVAFIVNHPAGRAITGIVRDTDYDGSDNTGSLGVTSTASETVNGFTTSRVVHTFVPPRPGGFSCPAFGGATRRLSVPLRFRVVDSTGERSAPVSAAVQFVETDDCFGRTDYPHMHGQSQNKTVAVPGEPVTFSFRADDADSTGNNDHFDKYRYRWRRLNDGATSGLTCINPSGSNDNDLITQNVSFPSRGRYVVEAELGGEDDSCGGFENAGNWFRMGAVDVNDAASTLTGSINFTGAAVRPSNPPSVNAGEAGTAVATVADSGGAVQRIEWDDGDDGAFERSERTNAFRSGNAVVQGSVSGAQLQEPVDTTTSGLRTVRARISDSAATDIVDLNGSFTLVRSRTISTQLRINAIPTAADGSVVTDEDTPVTITLAGNDADDQPEPLMYEVVTPPPSSDGTLAPVSGNTVTFTPAPNFHGSTSFEFRTRDGGPDTVAAHATSNTATVSLTVNPVNDAPVAEDVQAATEEDTPVEIALVASDVDDTVLEYQVVAQPEHGTVACDGALCTYEPAADFHGDDSFAYRVSDPHGAADEATVAISVSEVLHDTMLQASALVRVTDLSTVLSIRYRARLTRRDTGEPIPGKPITFVVGGQSACTAATGADGVASCQWSISRALATLIGSGYDAVFSGDEDHEPASDHGPILGI